MIYRQTIDNLSNEIVFKNCRNKLLQIFSRVDIEQNSKLQYKFQRNILSKYIGKRIYLFESKYVSDSLMMKYQKIHIIDSKTKLKSFTLYFDDIDLKLNRLRLSNSNDRSVIFNFDNETDLHTFLDMIPMYNKWVTETSDYGYTYYHINTESFINQSFKDFYNSKLK